MIKTCLKRAPAILALSAVGLLATGCSSTPVPEMFIQHFNDAAQNPQQAECVNKSRMATNRQLVLSPTAVESTWTYCLNQFGLFAPGQNRSEPVAPAWGDR